MREKGIVLTTADLDSSLQPDVVADITALPFPNASFDVVTAYEILEHMPYEKSLRGMQELQRVSSEWVIISLPNAMHAFRFAATIPRVGYMQKVISIPAIVPPSHPYAKSHEWEIGIKGYAYANVVADIVGSGFTLVRSYRVYENPYHQFFILRKSA